MKPKHRRHISFVILFSFIALALWAQDPSGTVRGKITDQQGLPLPGASLYLRSDKIMGMKTFITTDTGTFQFLALLPGTYQLTLEMPGFKTAVVDDITIHAGRSVNLAVRMEMTTVDEEVTLDIFVPTIDEEKANTTSIIDFETLTHIPFQRNLREAISSASGILTGLAGFPPAAALTGGSERNSLYISDSLTLSDPLAMNTVPKIYYDLAHEIEVETAGHLAEVPNTEAGYINVITRSGGPELQGELLVQHTSESLSTGLSSPQDLADQNLTLPATHTSLWDMSLALHGPVYGDLLRFYTNINYIRDNRTSTFSPWTDPQGTEHSSYSGKYSDFSAFFRLSGRFTQEFKFIGSVYYTHSSYPAYTDLMAAKLPEESTSKISPAKSLLLTGWLNYTVNRQTYVDLKTSYLLDDTQLLLNQSGASMPQYIDDATGYSWGSGDLNNLQKLSRFHASAVLVHFNDRIWGAGQKIKLGMDYESAGNDFSSWKGDNLIVRYLDGSPYYFGLDTSPLTGEPVGTGRVAFSLLGNADNPLLGSVDVKRLGFFLQDTITVASRVSLNLGLRFDHNLADVRDTFKSVSANPLSRELGEAFILPVALLSPYEEIEFPNWDSVFSWNTFSPRLGMVIDILGNGRILLKGAYARQHEPLRSQTVSAIGAINYQRQHEFFWFDENQDQEVNTGDAFLPFPEDYRIYHPDYYKSVVADGLKSPHSDEIMVGVESELIRDFSVRLSYTVKQKKNIMEDVLYSLDTDQEWYTTSKDKEDWWIPFDTLVPAGSTEYADSQITLYYPSRTSPPQFYRLNNVPELERNYKGVELVLKKRMSHNWQFMGSLVYSKTTGNIGIGPEFSIPYSDAANSPNYFVNIARDSILDYDVPLAIKLMGTYRFPFEFYLSFYYTYLRGYPWTRDVTVIPNDEWVQENNIFPFPTQVYSEAFGSSRYDSRSNLNLRLEKELRTRMGRLNLSLDIYNALGSKYNLYDLNDGGYWFPAGEDTSEGERIVSPVYGQGVNLQGLREYRLTLRLFF